MVAEGVETPEQFQFLKEHDCDEMQGHIISPALDRDAFAEILRQGWLPEGAAGEGERLTMPETTLWLVGVLLVVGTTVLVAMWRSSKGRDNRFEQVFSRMEARLDEQGRRTETLATGLHERGGRTEDIVRTLDRELRQGQAAAGEALVARLGEAGRQQQKSIHELEQNQLGRIEELKQQLERRHMETYKSLNQTLQAGVDRGQQQMTQAVTHNSDELGKRMDKLTASTDKRLLDISGQVDKRLSEGFEKTVATFADVQKRLELIDDAQKKITELSGNVVSLQEVLADRTSRGTFGEVQLQALVANVLPESSYRMQHTLSNGRCVDCMLFLPEPTGSVPIDSKFPLENFRRKDRPGAQPERPRCGGEGVRPQRPDAHPRRRKQIHHRGGDGRLRRVVHSGGSGVR